jgi:hypothetical protein
MGYIYIYKKKTNHIAQKQASHLDLFLFLGDMQLKQIVTW